MFKLLYKGFRCNGGLCLTLVVSFARHLRHSSEQQGFWPMINVQCPVLFTNAAASGSGSKQRPAARQLFDLLAHFSSVTCAMAKCSKRLKLLSIPKMPYITELGGRTPDRIKLGLFLHRMRSFFSSSCGAGDAGDRICHSDPLGGGISQLINKS